MTANLVSLAEAKDYVSEPQDEPRYVERLQMCLDAATDGIVDYCQRPFVREDTTADPTATPKQYRIKAKDAAVGYVFVDDFYTLTGLTVAGVTDWTAGPFETERLPGFPWWRIESTQLRAGQVLTVTALWGWNKIPPKVSETCLELTAELFKRKDSPFGVVGFDQMGAVRVGDSDKRLTDRLARFRKHPVLVA